VETNLTVPLVCLMVMVAWTAGLSIAIEMYRRGQVHLGKAEPQDFPGGERHGTDRYWRLNRAHMNAVENLPLFAGVVLIAHAAEVAHGTLDMFAAVYVIARISHTTVHLLAGTAQAAQMRFFFYTVQLAVIITFLALIPMIDYQRFHPEAYLRNELYEPAEPTPF